MHPNTGNILAFVLSLQKNTVADRSADLIGRNAVVFPHEIGKMSERFFS